MEKEIYNEKEDVKKISNYIKIIIYKNETMLVTIESNNNVFSMTRSEFEKIEEELLNYDFYLYNSNNKQAYYIKIKEPNNCIRQAFNNSTKDKIFFGKDVLNNKVKLKEIKENIKKIGK